MATVATRTWRDEEEEMGSGRGVREGHMVVHQGSPCKPTLPMPHTPHFTHLLRCGGTCLENGHVQVALRKGRGHTVVKGII